MCQRVQCRTCGRPTYSGCGLHVEQVLAGVPPAERCQCREQRLRDRAARAAAGGGKPSWWSRLTGR